MNPALSLFFRFFLTGVTGAALSLLITWGLTTFILGTDHYFSAYLVGISVNLLFNFLVYTYAVFKTTHDHLRRLGVFLFYGVIMAFLQGATVHFITSLVGATHYLFVIAGVIALFAVLNFFVFKLSIFKEYKEGETANPRAVLVFIILCAVLLRVALLLHVLSHEGIDPLVYGDAYGYRELATNLGSGEGFVTSRDTGEIRPEIFRTPGLPLLMAPFAASDTGLAFYLLLLAVGAGIALPALTFALSNRFLPRGGALFVAALVAFEPHLAFFSVLPQTEVPFIVFAYGGLYAGFLAYERRAWMLAALSGALIAYAILIKPGFLPVFVVAFGALLVYAFFKKRDALQTVLFSLLLCMLVLAPWFLRTHSVTGVWTLSGAGWRNVYTDYVASVRAIEKGTEFSIEKRALKENAEEAGVPTEEVDNPAYAHLLRDYALKELWEKKDTVVKLEATLLTSYFLQDGYFYQMRRFLIIPASEELSRVSPTFILLKDGIAGIPVILKELGNQYFIPIIGRLWTLTVFISALIGFFVMKHRMRYLFALVIGLSALAATAIGLGVESRLRLPMLPLLFIFAVAAWTYLYGMSRLGRHASRPSDTRV